MDVLAPTLLPTVAHSFLFYSSHQHTHTRARARTRASSRTRTRTTCIVAPAAAELFALGNAPKNNDESKKKPTDRINLHSVYGV